ncbi:hypothetical protein BKA59DRAFT_459222 [Fusarium tricinctum]|uniref:Uncharacterized protein n=1 Tax=Fusarium tricinctum TaxID=61284 RepID=A0A8K0W794_9HYPO|nr:hypothetical protein BKA59DRAFT_459222 [Fusarium tricinctum]
MSFQSSPEHYMEPLPLRRDEPFRPLCFSHSQRRRRRHRPEGFDLFKKSNFYYLTTDGKLMKQVDALRAKHPHRPINKNRDYAAEINAIVAWLKAGRPAQREQEQAQEVKEEQGEELEEELVSAMSPPMRIPEIERPPVDMLELLIPESPVPEDSQYVSEYKDSPFTYELLTPRSPKYNTLRTSSGRHCYGGLHRGEWAVDDSSAIPSIARDIESNNDESNDDEVRDDLFLFAACLALILVFYAYAFFLLGLLEHLARG